MSTEPLKRKPPTSHTGSSPYAKRHRPSYADDDEDMSPSVTPYERPRNHPIYGQKSAFPGLDSAGDDELFYGPADDGLEYLRMVRSEANNLPFLFTAPQSTETPMEQDEDTPAELQPGPEPKTETTNDGVYVDGVYVAAPVAVANVTVVTTETPYSDAQSSYYNLLHHRFLLLRSTLKCTPPSEAISALDESHPISFPRHSKMARKEWRRLLLVADPQTVQLACMDMESVLGVLGIMARLMSENVRSGDAQRVRRIAAWAWGLLGKCRDVGQLGSEEVGEIRDLGKRAVKILRKMKEESEKKRSAELDGDASSGESDDENPPDNENPPDDPADQTVNDNTGEADNTDQAMPDAELEPSTEELEIAKAQLQAKLDDVAEESETEQTAEEATAQTRAMLDMIITVVGERKKKERKKERKKKMEITIPTTTLSTTDPPHTIYNITLRLPLRTFTITKRYTDFLSLHKTLLTQTPLAPPAPLPPKTWFSSTVSNAQLRESRRQALETYLQSINDAEDARWRNTSAWRTFLNLPSSGSNSATATRLHAAAAVTGAGEDGIRDPTVWLDVYRDLKGHLHDARLHLTRRDQETAPLRQHESSARAKSCLVRAGSLVGALEEGLKRFGHTSTSTSSTTSTGGGNGGGGMTGLGEGEIRRRKDLVINARKEKDGLEDLLNAMAAKSRLDNAVASIQDKEALMGGSAGKKPARSGRVLGRETERTRELDNQGVLQLQRTTMQEQDRSVEELMKIVHRQKELGVAINEELEVQNALLKLTDEDAERLSRKVDIGKKRIGKIS
ncbi:hypothetical protein BDV25DRAFT_168264 [Aspergillus avenaceus]|uniref:PX domain-containing protein n=1 Tax=Aspergillus avenaceus TaxID=36643 RepID=A0A5N6TQZ2_ASPAV|nr:hypothetical protein BDV25DRAFT_168264 [Aspergillus avenaceus]